MTDQCPHCGRSHSGVCGIPGRELGNLGGEWDATSLQDSLRIRRKSMEQTYGKAALEQPETQGTDLREKIARKLMELDHQNWEVADVAMRGDYLAFAHEIEEVIRAAGYRK